MMKRFLRYFPLILALLLSGCEGMTPDNSRIENQMADLQRQIDELRAGQERLNQSVTALQTAVEELQRGGYVTAVEDLVEEGQVTGHILRFNDGRSIEVRDGVDGNDGQDGNDGLTPDVSIRKENDTWYWTLNGDWLLDGDGNRVKASGTDGTTPRFEIRDGYWYVLYDTQSGWQQLEKAVGENGKDGDAFFTGFRTDEHFVFLTLKDGTLLQIPRFAPAVIRFSLEDNRTTIGPGEEIRIPFTLENQTDKTVVSASSDGNYKVRVEKGWNDGTIYVTAPSDYKDGYVNVLVDNGNGYVTLQVINFSERRISFADGLTYAVAATGGTVAIPLTANFDYRIEVDERDSDWISVLSTRSEFSATVTLQVAMNGTYAARVGHAYLIPEDGDGSYRQTITINQASAYFSMSRTGFVVAKEAGEAGMTVTSTQGLVVSIPPDAPWLTAEAVLEDASASRYAVTFRYEANPSAVQRAVEITFLAADGTTRLGSVSLIQASQDADALDAMVLLVRANFANYYTIYLPVSTYDGYAWLDENGNWFSVDQRSPVDCYIDWGDGTVEHYADAFDESGNRLIEFRSVHHTYPETDNGVNYIVRILGKVPCLNGDQIPAVNRSGVREIRQWGHTGIRVMSDAFNGCNKLEKIATDEGLAFAETISFNRAFQNCVSLAEIPEGLFRACSNVLDYTDTFLGCTALTSLPSGLFAQSSSVRWMRATFRECHSVTEVPVGLFEGCGTVEDLEQVLACCSKLRSVPENLFTPCPLVRTFRGVFASSGLASVPEGIFAGNPLVTNFEIAFEDCQFLTAVPQDLFAPCPDVTNFAAVFRYCGNIRHLPIGIFDHNRKVESFYEALSRMQSTGESPYTVIDGRKYHLYERAYNEDHFVSPVSYSDCFYGSEHFSDYARIPRKWGGPNNDNNYNGSGQTMEGFGYEQW